MRSSCWAFAATSALSDRIRIAAQDQWPEVNLAPQVLLNCGNAGTCQGGDSGAAYQYINQQGITDETCAPYQAIDLNCTAINVCKTCAPDFSNPAKKCQAQKPNKLWKVSQYGSVSGAANMMAEIYARGPITCAIAVTQPFVNYNGGIFQDTTGAKTPDHEISLVGFGVGTLNSPNLVLSRAVYSSSFFPFTDPQTNTQYWIGRNSWGTPWGEIGFFRLVRGVDNLGIESNGCNWAVPIMN
jgi:cathepsin X